MSSFKDTLKVMLYNVIRARAVNVLMRTALKPLSRILPAHVIGRVPVSGDICIGVGGSRRLVFWSDGSDQVVSRLYWNGIDAYEPGTVRVFLRLAGDGGVVLDVGAHSGLFALLAAVKYPQTEVHAFEPLARICTFLDRNIAINGLDNIRSVCAVVAKRSGRVPFYEPRTVTLPSSASLRKGFVREKAQEVMLPAVTLDEYAQQKCLSRVTLIKIDVEGAEYGVLEGAVRLIDRDRPAIICEVLLGLADEGLTGFLKERMYRAWRISAEDLIPETEIKGGETEAEWNYLFLPEERMTGDLSDLMAPRPAGQVAS